MSFQKNRFVKFKYFVIQRFLSQDPAVFLKISCVWCVKHRFEESFHRCEKKSNMIKCSYCQANRHSCVSISNVYRKKHALLIQSGFCLFSCYDFSTKEKRRNLEISFEWQKDTSTSITNSDFDFKNAKKRSQKIWAQWKNVFQRTWGDSYQSACSNQWLFVAVRKHESFRREARTLS